MRPGFTGYDSGCLGTMSGSVVENQFRYRVFGGVILAVLSCIITRYSCIWLVDRGRF